MTIRGNLLRLRGGRAIAIYVRDGVVSVADFTGGRCEIYGVADWYSTNGRKLVSAQRRGEVEITAIPLEVTERIEHAHRDAVAPKTASCYSALMPAAATTLFQRAISSLR